MKDIEKSVMQSVCLDGLLEITAGVYLTIVGLILSFQPRLVVFSVFFVFIFRPLVARVKNRYIYPRVGYVKLREEDSSEAKGIALTAVFSIVFLAISLIALIMTLGTEAGQAIWFRWFLPVTGSILFAFGPLWLARHFGLKRGYIMAAFVPLCGITIAVTGIATAYFAVGLICFAGGIPALIWGSVVFSRFLKNNPIEEEVEKDEEE